MYAITMNFQAQGLYQLINQLRDVADRQAASLAVASSLVGAMRDRIHTQGIATNGSQIGTYSPQYMVVRTGAYKNSKTGKKGKMAGKVTSAGKYTSRTIRLNKQTGVFTGEEKVGKNRPNYHRDSDTKVILSLTRQQEKDLVVVVVDANTYGIGYVNELSFKKSQWEEEMYKKKIFDLTKEELEKANEAINTFTHNALS